VTYPIAEHDRDGGKCLDLLYVTYPVAEHDRDGGKCLDGNAIPVHVLKPGLRTPAVLLHFST